MIQVKFSEAVGKTIKAMDDNGSDRYTLVFTDDTFCQFQLFGGEYVYLEDDKVDLTKPYSIRNSDTLIGLGILDQAEYDKAEAEYMLAHNARQREYKLQQFNNLKQELGL